MQLITLEKGQTTKLFWLLMLLIAAVIVFTAKQPDPGIVGGGVVLALVSAMPFYLWLLGWSRGLPIWPVFALVTGMGYALPMVQNPDTLQEYSAAQSITAGMVTAGFILLGTFIWIGMTGRVRPAPRVVRMIQQEHAVRYLMIFLATGVLFGINQVTGWLRLPGNLMPVMRGIALSLNTMALFVLAFYHGRGLLTKAQFLWLAAGATATCLMAMTNLMIAQAIIPAAMVIMGYALGSNKVPWRVLIILVVALVLLHPGKYEMRNRYWNEGKRITLTGIPSFYSEWVGLGMKELGGLSGVLDGKTTEEGSSTVFERAGSFHMLLRVMDMTPREVPYLNGITYEIVPRLLLPRFIDDEKGYSHAGSVMLSVNYGLVTTETMYNVSIAWGLIPEAYANYGYIGIAGLAIVLAIFYGWITNLTVGVPMTSLRFVLGLLIMASATRADTMGIFVSMQFQGVMGVVLAAMVMMKRQPNPFASEQGAANGGARQEVRGKWGNSLRDQGLKGAKDQGANGRAESGMPAPGILAGLIEGERPEVADQGAKGLKDEGLKGPKDERSEEHGAGNAVATPRDVGTGGTVRTLPTQTPKRIARWMPRRVRAAVTAQQLAAADDRTTGPQDDGEGNGEGLKDEELKRLKDGRERPRQVAVPYRNYRRYRDA